MMTTIDWSRADTAAIDGRAFASVVAAVSTQAEYATFAFAPDGSLTVTACSPDHVTMVKADMPAGAVTGRPPARATFKLAQLADALKGLQSPVSIESVPGRVRIGDGRIRTVVPLEGIEDDAKFPDLALPVTVVLPSDPLAALLSRATKETAACRLSVSPAGLDADMLDASTGIGSSLTIPASDCTYIEGTAYSAYPMKPWAAILRVVPKGADISVELADSYPCRVGCDGEGWSMTWLCAPRIEEEGL